MELALVPLSAHGNFYEGDCYVILSVSTVLPSPLILTSSSPESQFQGFPGRSAHKVNQASLVSILILPRYCMEQASSLTIKGCA